MKPQTIFYTLLLVFVAGCAAAPDTPVRLTEPEPLVLATAPGSTAPRLTTGPDGLVYAIWIDPVEEGAHALRYASYEPGSVGWSAPRTIARGTQWFVNWADVPSLAVGEHGFMVAHWLAYNGEGKYAYGVQVSRSTDGGQTWSEPVWLHEDASPTEHGFVSLVPLGPERMQAFWLDGRRFAEGDHSMTFRTRTVGADGSLGPEHLLDALICDCCPSAAVAVGDGGLLAVYRNRTEEEIRDIWRVRYDGEGWSEPAPVHEDGWRIPGCPVNGPALAARGDHVAVAWFTAAAEEPRVKAAFSHDGGRTFEEPVRLDLGQPTGRVGLTLLDDGSALVGWIEAKGEGGTAGWYVRRVTTDGTTGEAQLLMPSTTSRAGGYPRMARSGDELLLVWTEPGTPGQVRAARSRIVR